MEEQVLGDDLLGRHVRDAHQREHFVGASGGEQRRRQLQGVGGEHVVVGEPVDQQQADGSGRRRGAAATTRRRPRAARSGRRDSAPCSACRTAATPSPVPRRPQRGCGPGATAPPGRRGTRRSSSRGWRPVRDRGSRARRQPARGRRSGPPAASWRGRRGSPAPTRVPRPGVPRPSTTRTANPWSANHCETRCGVCERSERRACGPPYGSSSTGSGDPS